MRHNPKLGMMYALAQRGNDAFLFYVRATGINRVPGMDVTGGNPKQVTTNGAAAAIVRSGTDRNLIAGHEPQSGGTIRIWCWDDTGVDCGTYTPAPGIAGEAHDLTIDANRWFVVGSDGSDLFLYQTDDTGTLDPDFGTDGIVRVPTAVGRSVAVDDQQRIYVAGDTGGDMAVWRFVP